MFSFHEKVDFFNKQSFTLLTILKKSKQGLLVSATKLEQLYLMLKRAGCY
jgi:hypothetical protein